MTRRCTSRAPCTCERRRERPCCSMSACGAGDGGVPRDAREGGYSAQDFVAACHIHPAQTASGPLLVGPLLCLSHHFPPPSRDGARIAFASLASAMHPSASRPLMSRDLPTARVEGRVLSPPDLEDALPSCTVRPPPAVARQTRLAHRLSTRGRVPYCPPRAQEPAGSCDA